VGIARKNLKKPQQKSCVIGKRIVALHPANGAKASLWHDEEIVAFFEVPDPGSGCKMEGKIFSEKKLAGSKKGRKFAPA